MKKRFFVITLLLLLLCSCAASAQTFDGENVKLTVLDAQTDGNAMLLTFEVENTSGNTSLYGILEKVYVNGIEVDLMKSTGTTYCWLTSGQRLTITMDIADVPNNDSYTVAAGYTVLEPKGEIQVMPALTDDNFLSYQTQATELNDKGYVVISQEGDILLARGTYEEDAMFSAQLEQAGKMTVVGQVQSAFSVSKNVTDVYHGEGLMEMEGWMLFVEKAELSPMSMALTLKETFPATMSLAEAEAAARRMTVTDMAGGKSFYAGCTQELSEVELQPDGSYQAIFTWRSQSILSLPEQIRVTPYTYNAKMNIVEDVEHTLIISFAK